MQQCTKGGSEILSKGAQHNVYFKKKHWIETITIGTKTAKATWNRQSTIV
jgi:hypothetical protein